ncbi:uncharacterized protein VDAG_02721 [Verticillium dahliae VdLs.17]|uniref:Uncharacterized protein n=1 Tax=Verticillium dahliae (strain VdLs.17 / ATCC MYA-4575 / FGSC 10137) TaxID=498257 RepID=G2WWU2_VERDV|nr:uncharacterized protein VDAG_02721 [Verticillium dahliae VdLs.17]EGY21197.1 hypothetical protein VDAG_02721 [Verticillium dahliae VdLs.17]
MPDTASSVSLALCTLYMVLYLAPFAACHCRKSWLLTPVWPGPGQGRQAPPTEHGQQAAGSRQWAAGATSNRRTRTTHEGHSRQRAAGRGHGAGVNGHEPGGQGWPRLKKAKHGSLGVGASRCPEGLPWLSPLTCRQRPAVAVTSTSTVTDKAKAKATTTATANGTVRCLT